MKDVIKLVVLTAILIGVYYAVHQHAVNRCEDKGAEFVRTSSSGGICVKDGKIVL